MLVSRKNFLEQLEQTDFFWFGNIKDDWNCIVKESQMAADNNPQFWSYLAVDSISDHAWDSIGEEYIQTLLHFKQWGYNQHNTVAWETTSSKPQISMEWENRVAKNLPLLNYQSKPTLQTPGNIMPWHQDKFISFRRNYPNAEGIVRFLVFLKSWKTGHLLQAGNSKISHWDAGDVIIWHPDRMHLSVNVGMENKWTVNYTGILLPEFELIDIPKNVL